MLPPGQSVVLNLENVVPVTTPLSLSTPSRYTAVVASQSGAGKSAQLFSTAWFIVSFRYLFEISTIQNP
jgi:hypothetical protein